VQTIDLDTDVLFAFNSANLSAKARGTLQAAATALQHQPKRRLGIYGHTDSKGQPAYNLTLSLQRATAVQNALAPLLGAGWTFDVKGFGETRPVAPETTSTGQDYPDGRALNRRVELTLLG
jgi:outer membrane protein OmpA-like peptidoglycan-associated protein